MVFRSSVITFSDSLRILEFRTLAPESQQKVELLLMETLGWKGSRFCLSEFGLRKDRRASSSIED